MSKKILLIVAVLSAFVIGIITYLIIDTQTKNKQDENSLQTQIQDITIEAFDMSLRIDESGKKLNYTIHNPSNLEYEKTIYVTGTGITVDGDLVEPQKVGNWYVTILVTFNNKSVSKIVKVNVLNSNFSAQIEILDNDLNPITNLFFTNWYKLKITMSKQVEYTLLASENVDCLQKISSENNVDIYTFNSVEKHDIHNVNVTSFSVEYCGLTFSANVNTYCYQQKFNILFSKGEQNGIIRLHTYNNLYTKNANADGIYNSTTFAFENDTKYMNNYICEISNTNVAILDNNQIVAQNEGECEFNIILQDGSNYVQTYKVVVESVKIDNFSNKNDITINIGEKHIITYSYSPMYSINNIEIYVDGEKTTQTELVFEQAGNHSVLILDTVSNKQVTYNVKVQNYIFEVEFLQSFINEYEAVFENNTLTIACDQEFYVPFDYQIAPSNLCESVECEITFSQNQGLNLVVEYQESNAVVLKVKGKGSAKVNITLKENVNIVCCFAIVVV